MYCVKLLSWIKQENEHCTAVSLDEQNKSIVTGPIHEQTKPEANWTFLPEDACGSFWTIQCQHHECARHQNIPPHREMVWHKVVNGSVNLAEVIAVWSGHYIYIYKFIYKSTGVIITYNIPYAVQTVISSVVSLITYSLTHTRSVVGRDFVSKVTIAHIASIGVGTILIASTYTQSTVINICMFTSQKSKLYNCSYILW